MNKKIIFLSLFIASFFIFVSGVSAESFTYDEMASSAEDVFRYTQENSKVPKSVKINGKTATDENYLNMLTNTVVKISNGNKAGSTIPSRKAPSKPQGTGKGTLTKSQYITVAKNINSFYSSNGQAPNFAYSSVGEIRYESLIYGFSKVLYAYERDGTLPSEMSFPLVSGISSSGITVDTTPPSTSINLAGGWYNTVKTVTLTASDNKDTNPSVYYKINTGDWVKGGKSVSISLKQGTTNLYYKAKDAKGNVETQKSVTYKIDTTKPTVSQTYDNGTLILTASDNMDTNPTIYYRINGGSYISSSKTARIVLNEGRYIINYFAADVSGNTGLYWEFNVTHDITPPEWDFNLEEGWYNSTKALTINVTDNLDSNPIIAYKINNNESVLAYNSVIISLNEGINLISFLIADHYGNSISMKTLLYYIDLTPPVVNNNLEEGNYSYSKTLKLNVTDNMDSNPVLYYRINDGDWVSKNKSAQIFLDNGTYFIEYYAVDRAGNHAILKNLTFNINTTNIEEEFYPAVDSNLVSGWYNNSKNLTLESNSENLTVYYSINNGSFISENSSKVVLNLSDGYYFIQYKAVDNLGNETTVKTLMIIINETGNLTLPGRVINYNNGRFYNNIQEAIDANETLVGDYIGVLAGIYEGNYIINKSIILSGDVNGETVLLPEDNSLSILFLDCDEIIISGFTFKNSNGGSSGDNYYNASAIFLNDVSNCTIIQNKFTNNKCSIINNGSERSSNVWILYNNFNIGDSNIGVYVLNASDYFIGYNIFNTTDSRGLKISNVNDFLILSNVFRADDGAYAVESLYSSSIIFEDNSFSNFTYGVSIVESNNYSIKENSFIDNGYGIYIEYGDNINILLNSFYDNYIDLNCFIFNNLNVSNNWWGTNSPIISSLFDDSVNILLFDLEGFYFDSWIIANASPTSYKVFDGKVYESTITVDMTHNNLGEDVSSLGCIPDGIIINFISEYGTITNSSELINGIAQATLIINRSIIGDLSLVNLENVTCVAATINDYMIYTYVFENPTIDVYLLSSAIDTLTNQSLAILLSLPLNDSVSWISILWRNTGIFKSDIDIIYNGEVIYTSSIVNTAYIEFKDLYSDDVFKVISLFNSALIEYDDFQYTTTLNYIVQNWNNFKLMSKRDKLITYVELYNYYYEDDITLSDSDIEFILNNHERFIDELLTGITYFGDTSLIRPISSLNISTSKFPDSSLKTRSSNIYYINGENLVEDIDFNMSDVHSAGYEGLRSYVIATKNVTVDDLSYWLSFADNSEMGAMKAAYGSFLELLNTIYCHDRVADQAAFEFNVTWNRTTPIMMSLCNDFDHLYGTGESDHRMGIDIYGDEKNVWAFRSACSFSFSLVEQLTGGLGITFNNDGVLMGILNNLAHGDKLEISFENGYILVRTESDFERMLLIDLETGIIRDFFSSQNIMGNPCYHDDITDAIVNFTNNLLNISSKLSSDLNKLVNFSIMFSGVFSSLFYELSGTGTLSFSGIGLGSLFSVFSAALLIPATIELCRPFWANTFEDMGRDDLAEFYRNNNFVDIFIDSFTPNLNNIDILRGVPNGTTMNEIGDKLYSLNYNNIMRAGLIISLMPGSRDTDFDDRNVEITYPRITPPSDIIPDPRDENWTGIMENIIKVKDAMINSAKNGDIVRFVSNAAVLTGAISMVGLTFTDLSKEVIYMIINGKLLNNSNKAP